MSRRKLPDLTNQGKLNPRQEEVEPRNDEVRVHEHVFHRLLEGVRAPAVFFVWTPRPTHPAGVLVTCTPEACQRWVQAVIDYAAAVDEVSAELSAAHRRAASLPWWRHLAVRRALVDWEEIRRRYERVMREAAEAYEPVGREIRQAVQEAEERAAEEAYERTRRAEEVRRGRSVLAARPVWGWSEVTDEGGRAVYVFRHDVPGAVPGESPQVDLRGLRRALTELGLPDVRWDATALAETERELAGIDFGLWWRDLFHEDYRTVTSPPPPRSSSYGRGNPSGGTATGGTGGFTGGFSCGGGF
ncbi:hypothetical protein [Streptomyces sp. R44]|uniref:Uncharacterized protein n=1 Tax=Streptomyces sp. R44 TaxID=3238633 RepID=A0AB39SQT9_9ACTN